MSNARGCIIVHRERAGIELKRLERKTGVTSDDRGNCVNDDCRQSWKNVLISDLSIWLMKPEDNTLLELTPIYPPHFPLFLCLALSFLCLILPRCLLSSLCLFSHSVKSLCFYKAALYSLGQLIVLGSLCLSFRLLS